jgi:hypothetical protein
MKSVLLTALVFAGSSAHANNITEAHAKALVTRYFQNPRAQVSSSRGHALRPAGPRNITNIQLSEPDANGWSTAYVSVHQGDGDHRNGTFTPHLQHFEVDVAMSRGKDALPGHERVMAKGWRGLTADKRRAAPPLTAAQKAERDRERLRDDLYRMGRQGRAAAFHGGWNPIDGAFEMGH